MNEISSKRTEKQEMSFKEAIFEWLCTSVKTIVIFLILCTFVFSLFTVKGDSMLPTLQDGNKVIVYSLFYKPSYKDIIVVNQPDYAKCSLVKRIIATEGQIVNIDPVEKKVFVDGKELNEPYIYEPTVRMFDVEFPIKVPKNSVFVMGDNRNYSVDSRDSSIGMIDERYIKGKVILKISPVDNFGVVK